MAIFTKVVRPIFYRTGPDIHIKEHRGLSMMTDRNDFDGSSAAALVAGCEELHRRRLGEIADAIAAARTERGIRMVLISGPSSSGKTTFAKRLCAALTGRGINPVQISIDDYFVDREATPRDADGNYDFEAVEAVDLALLNDQLQRLIAGEPVIMPLFDFVSGTRRWQAEAVHPSAESVFVIEGLHALNPRLTNLIPDGRKFKIFIAPLSGVEGDDGREVSPFDMRLLRRITRDNAHRGRSASETLEQWPIVRRGEELYVFPFRGEADASFDSSLRYELRALRPLTEPLLAGVPADSHHIDEARRLAGLLGAFEPLSATLVPDDSILREFISR